MCQINVLCWDGHKRHTVALQSMKPKCYFVRTTTWILVIITLVTYCIRGKRAPLQSAHIPSQAPNIRLVGKTLKCKFVHVPISGGCSIMCLLVYMYVHACTNVVKEEKNCTVNLSRDTSHIHARVPTEMTGVLRHHKDKHHFIIYGVWSVSKLDRVYCNMGCEHI